MEEDNYIRNLFLGNTGAPHELTFLEAEQFIDLASDLTLKIIYRLASLISFLAEASLYFLLVSGSCCIVVPFARFR